MSERERAGTTEKRKARCGENGGVTAEREKELSRAKREGTTEEQSEGRYPALFRDGKTVTHGHCLSPILVSI